MSTLTILEIVGILLIVAWNAFFVSAEYAFVAVRRTRIDELVEEGSGAAKRVRHLIDDPARFISAFQVAITLSSLALGAVGEPAVSLTPRYGRDGHANRRALTWYVTLLSLIGMDEGGGPAFDDNQGSGAGGGFGSGGTKL